jgi:hypothetical protein
MERRRERSRRPDRQHDLFLPTTGTAAGPAPSRGSLPQRTREAVTGLMMRLLAEHAAGAHGERRDGDER